MDMNERDLKTRSYSKDMKERDLKTRPYSKDMNERDLMTRPYNMNMNKEDQTKTLPKKGLKTRPYNMDMEKKDLKKLTKAQLIRLLLKQKAQIPGNSIKQMANKHEDIIQPPEQFRDGYKPIPKPRTDRPFQMQDARRLPKPQRPPPPPKREPLSKIKELNQALKGHAKSYGIEL